MVTRGHHLQVSAKSIDGPRRDNVELFTCDGAEKPIELRALLPAFGTTDAVIDVLGDDRPTVALDRRM